MKIPGLDEENEGQFILWRTDQQRDEEDTVVTLAAYFLLYWVSHSLPP